MSKIDKPWGYEEILINNDKYVIKKLVINGEHRLSLQKHQFKRETWLIQEGEGIITLRSRIFNYKIRGEPRIIDIPAGLIHRIEAIIDTVIYEVSTTELNDVIRIEDDYGRIK